MEFLLPKIRQTRELISAHGGEIWLQVDGGVTEETIGLCAAAGADMFVAGTAVYGAEDPAEAVSALRERAVTAAAATGGLAGGQVSP
jgi:ribulose-phosphate 3-epimerase